MPDRQNRPRKKPGLYGWRAFLVVLGSGLAAGLLVVVLVVSMLRIIASNFESGTQQPQSDGAAPTRGPVTSLEPGSFDLCDSLENMQAFSAIAPDRTDDGNSFADTALNDPEQELRTIENTCKWDVQVGGLVESEFSFTYASYVSDGSSADEHASNQFAEGESDIDGSVGTVADSGDLGVLEEGSYFAYGVDGSRERIAYIGRVKTSVFSIDVDSSEPDSAQESNLEAEYKALITELLPEIRVRLNRVVPD